VTSLFAPRYTFQINSPKEFSQPQDIENGANVLLNTVLDFDGMH